MYQSIGAIRKYLERRFGFAIRRFPVVDSRAAELSAVIGDMALDGVVDVGGHEGGFTRFLRHEVGYKGRVVSFEPFPQSFAQLSAASLGDPNWQVHNLAVGSHPGSKEFRVYTGSTANSFHRINAVGRERFPRLKYVSSISTEVGRLDQLYKPSWGKRLFLKSDTQGNDLDVIDSASGIIELIHGIMLEAGPAPIYDDAPSLVAAVERLAFLGFGPSSFHPVIRWKTSRAAVEFDIVFVRL